MKTATHRILLAAALITMTMSAGCLEPDDEIISSEIEEVSATGLSRLEMAFLREFDDAEDQRYIATAFKRDLVFVDRTGLHPEPETSAVTWDDIRKLVWSTCEEDSRTCLNCNGGGMTTSWKCPTPMCTCPKDCAPGTMCNGIAGDILTEL